MNARQVIEKKVPEERVRYDSVPAHVEAEGAAIYDRAMEEHSEWWRDCPLGRSPNTTKSVRVYQRWIDQLFDQIVAAYKVDPDSAVGEQVYIHIGNGRC